MAGEALILGEFGPIRTRDAPPRQSAIAFRLVRRERPTSRAPQWPRPLVRPPKRGLHSRGDGRGQLARPNGAACWPNKLRTRNSAADAPPRSARDSHRGPAGHRSQASRRGSRHMFGPNARIARVSHSPIRPVAIFCGGPSRFCMFSQPRSAGPWHASQPTPSAKTAERSTFSAGCPCVEWQAKQRSSRQGCDCFAST